MANLNDILVLNAEIAALVRAEIPLELGLRRLAANVSGRLSHLSEQLAIRLERGDSLVTALQAEKSLVSPMYAAVVEAALECHRLPEALEGLVQSGRTLQECRRQLQLALLYPLIVTSVGYGLLILMVTVVGRRIIELWDPLSPLRAQLLPLVELASEWAPWWGPGIPFVILLGFIALNAWRRYRTDTQFLAYEIGHGGLGMGLWVPGMPEVYRDLDRAYTTSVLGQLLSYQIPAPHALRLVGQIAGSQQLAESYRHLAESVESGRMLAAEVSFTPKLPRLIATLLRAGVIDRDLPQALMKASEIYYRRVQRRMTWLNTILFPVFLLAFAGTMTLTLTLLLVMPLYWLLQELFQFV